MDSQEFSSLVSLALDSMGYSYETVKQRQLLNIDFLADEIAPSENDDVRTVSVGSTAEGICQVWSMNSDIDEMLVLREVVAFENTPDTKSCKEDDLSLQMEWDNVAPGYTMIKCINMKSSALPNISQQCGFYVVERNNSFYLGHSLNEMFHEELRASPKKHTEREGVKEFCKISGPALTYILEETMSYLKHTCSYDCVYAIPCFCTSHIRNWVTRTKYYGWPDKELVSKVKSQIGYVVPVGFKGSKNFELEWRICYTEIEIILIRSLNETQIKMYALLKMIAKSILKPICEDITSYVIKNLVLWIVERNAKEIFTPENLTSLVMLGLRSLRNKVDMRLFGNYMIPERNLFAGRITEHEKIEAVRVLDVILAEGPFFLVKFKELNKLKVAIDEINDNPSLVEIKTTLWHYFSLVPLYKIRPDGYELFFMKLFVGLILLAKDSKLDELQKAKLKDLFFETENTYIGTTLVDLERQLEQVFGGTLDSFLEYIENSSPMMAEFFTMQ